MCVRTMSTRTTPTAEAKFMFIGPDSFHNINSSNIHDAFVGERLNGLDITVVILYFFIVLGIGIWAMWKTNRNTVSGYFLAGRNVLWWPVGASLFSSNVGSGHFIGLAGSGAATGIAVGAYEWNAMFVVLLLGWVFLPVYIASGVVTMPEYLYKRFGGKRIQMCISFVYLFIYIFTKISVDLYAGAIFINQALKWNLYASVLCLLLVTAVYTIGGGLAAVIYTDTLQTVVILAGAILLMVVGFIDIGGYSGLMSHYMVASPYYRLANHTECGVPRQDAFHVFRDQDANLPWTAVVFGMPILSVWYWCADQVIVQRTLAAKDLTHAKAGTILCSYLKVLPMFLMVMVGMISRAKFPDQVGCVVPEVCSLVCENPRSCSDIAYPKLVMELLPQGARGLLMAVMLSALMSSLTSIFNSSSTIFTMDIWNRARKNASERELMIVGRVFALVLVVISVIWIPIIQAEEGGQLFNYIQKISAYLQPPIAACFVLGIFWRRITEKGAFWGLCLGTLGGLVRLIVDFVTPDPVCGDADEDAILGGLHYLHFAIFLFLFTLLIIIVISLCTEPWPEDAFGGLTWWSREQPLSPHPMHLEGGKKDTEQSHLVDDDQLQKHSYGDVDSSMPPCGDAFEDIDLRSSPKPGSHHRHSLPREVSACYDGDGVEFRLKPTYSPEKEESNDRGHKVLYLRLLNFCCGFNDSSSQPGKQVHAIASLYEDPFWRRVTNINAVICVIFAISLWIVFR